MPGLGALTGASRPARHAPRVGDPGRPSTLIVTALASVVSALVAGALLRRQPPGGEARWTRTNHAGRAVTLLEGPAAVIGAVAGLSGPALAGTPMAVTAACATAVAGSLGLLDDLAGDASSKGLGGHLSALRRGRVTTGAVKLVGLGVAGLAVGVAADLSRSRREVGTAWGTCPPPVGRGSRSRHEALVRAAVVGVDAGVVAGCANLVNLLDLRPGRALKVTLAGAVPLAVGGSVPAAAALGAALAVLPDDLAGRSMLGDSGANALGALLGSALVTRCRPVTRAAVLAALTGLTLASERVSFTAVIESTPLLRELDAWGRPPTGPS